MADPSLIFQMALEHHKAGRLAEAESGYWTVLGENPQHAPALHLLGVLAMSAGQLEPAARFFRTSLGIEANNAMLHVNLAEVSQKLGQTDNARESYQRAIQLNGRLPAAHLGLAYLLQTAGEAAEAADCYENAIRLEPDRAAAYYNLGLMRQRLGDIRAAANRFRRVLELEPNHTGSLIGLGQILRDEGNQAEAVTMFQRAVQGNSDLIVAYGHLVESLEAMGRVVETIEPYKQLARLMPDSAEARYNVGAVQREAGMPIEALESFGQALAINPELVAAHVASAEVCNALSQPDVAVRACQRALEIDPECPQAYAHLGVARLGQADIEGALAAYRRNLELNPDSAANHSNYLYALNFPLDSDPRQVFEAHRAWARRHADPLSAEAAPHDNDPDPNRPLRVGYVCSQFRTHAISTFSEPLISAHDPRAVEVYCYYDDLKWDSVTTQFHAAAKGWQVIHRRPPAEAAELIRADKIDILVDLVGHVGGNQLLVFAHKPAPIQVTYLGYQNTTGMLAMDYRLTDEHADPPGMTESFYTEQLARLPIAFFCYRPPHPSPEVNPLPAATAGYVTFGSFNHQQKLTPQLMHAWARILASVPESRLLVLAYAEGLLEEKLRAILVQFGVAPARLQVVEKRPRYDYLQLFQLVDIALDSFPFNGHTTVCDAVWMGVPSVMLEGRRYASRFGGSVNRNVGLDDWIARDVEGYVKIAVQQANELEELVRLRRELRTRLVLSPLTNAHGFARRVEAAYRTMWRQWCATRE